MSSVSPTQGPVPVEAMKLWFGLEPSMFARPIAARVGPTVERGGFAFTDLEPGPAPGDFSEAVSSPHHMVTHPWRG